MSSQHTTQPFLASFERPATATAGDTLEVPIAYDLTLDLCVIASCRKPLARHSGLLRATGSHVTKADQDPTRDEPADR